MKLSDNGTLKAAAVLVAVAALAATIGIGVSAITADKLAAVMIERETSFERYAGMALPNAATSSGLRNRGRRRRDHSGSGFAIVTRAVGCAPR